MNTFDTAINKLTENYSSDMWLGRLVWYTVTDEVDVSHQTLNATVLPNFLECNIQPDVPGFPKAFDVFKRACTFAQRKNVPGPDDTKINYLVRPTGYDEQKIRRSIVREAIDTQGHRLNYTELVKVTYDRATEKLRFENVNEQDENDDENVNAIVEQIISYCQTNLDKVTSYAVREFCRKYLERKLFSTKVRPSGGVYFVSEKFADEVEALDRTMNALGVGVSFHFMPVLDDSKQREMLRVAFEIEAAAEIDDVIGEMAEAMSNKKGISADRFANFTVTFKMLREKIADYSDLLDEKLEATANRLDIMDVMLTELMTHVNMDK